MPSFGLRSATLAMILIVAASAFVGPVIASGGEAYRTTIKVLSGVVAMAGSGYLTRATGLTLLRSGGTPTFRAAYVAAGALCGLGLAEVLSALWPVNIGYALAACCVISLASGTLWMRFYGRVA